jgi:hypothetical protein
MITKRIGTVLGMAWAGHPKKVVKLPGKMAKKWLDFEDFDMTGKG